MTALKEAGVNKIYRRDNQPFAQVPNEAIRDPKITATGFRLLSYLMSHKDGYELTYSQIEAQTGMGRWAINQAIGNLEGLGWLKTQATKGSDGRYGPKSWTVLTPSTVGYSTAVDSTVDNPTDNKKTIYKEEQYKEQVNAQQVEPMFLDFWNLYPRKVGKQAAKKAYLKACNSVADFVILAGVKRLASDPNLPPKDFIPHPATWLNEGRWDDEAYPERTLSLTEKRAKEEAERLLRLQQDRDRQKAEKALRDAEEQARMDEIARNPVKYCVHDKVAVMCLKCRNQ